MSEKTDTGDILVVDDDSGLLQLMGMRLRALGYASRAVACGKDALLEIRRKPPLAVISDVKMDEMDGIALLQRIQAESPGLPVIMLTAHGSIKDAVDATQKGAYAFLTKPVDREELRTTLSEALAGKVTQAPTASVGNFVTRSSKLFQMLEQARLVAQSDVNVLINGESGSGKEVLAQAIHACSKRRDKPFVPINCGAIPDELMESELFGHKKGAFTGATRDHGGLFMAAQGGTIFLDEIGDMPPHLQVKLLRVLQERKIKPVGDVSYVDVDIRIVSATHKNLMDLIVADSFREDLYYRLNVVNFALPALRERREDIPLLFSLSLEKIATRYAQTTKHAAPEAIDLLVSHDWPGNVRELINFAEKCHALSSGPVISRELVAQCLPQQVATDLPMQSLSDAKKQFEKDYVSRLLSISRGNIPEAARLADRNRSDFFKIVKKHGLDAELYRS